MPLPSGATFELVIQEPLLPGRHEVTIITDSGARYEYEVIVS